MTPADELMALAGKATPGEWRQEHRRTATGGYSTEVFDEAGKPIATLAWHALPTRYEGEVDITSTDREANAAFIAAACNFVRSDAFRAMVRDAWLPIESAPKDGTRIMLANASGAWVGEYRPVYQSGYRPSNPWASMMLNHDHLPRGRSRCEPTHWRPLPEPPQAIDAAASGAGE